MDRQHVEFLGIRLKEAGQGKGDEDGEKKLLISPVRSLFTSWSLDYLGPHWALYSFLGHIGVVAGAKQGREGGT